MRNVQHQHQNNKRLRGRGGNRKGQNPLTRVYESNGPDVKIRGTASHVAEKYMQLARDSQSSGDPVSAENYYQHAEHYLRLIAAVQEQFRQNNPYYRENENREGNFEDSDDDGMEQGASGEPYTPREQPYQQAREQQPYPPREPREQREQRYQPRERDQNYQPRHQPPQAQPQPVQPAAAAPDGGDIERLPAFVTGGAPQPPVANGANGANGFEGAPDRFPLHRRRRRRHPPRDGAPQGAEGGEPRQPSE